MQPEQGTDTILIVEDDRRLRDIVKMILEDNGYRVFAAEDGPQALSLWEEHADGIGLLLTDLRIGDTTGWELAEKMRRQKPGLPVVYASGYSLEDIVGPKPGPFIFLKKPFQKSELLQTVRRCLGTEVG